MYTWPSVKWLRWFVVCAVAAGVPANLAAEVKVEKTQIADGVYLFSCGPDGYVPSGNSIVIVNESDVLVYDTFTRPSAARQVVEEIRKMTSKPVRYVVNSHWHPDHWSGNEAYAEAFPGVQIIASEGTREHMANTMNAWPKMFRAQLKQEETDYEKVISTGKAADGTPLTSEQRSKAEARVKRQREFTAEELAVHRTLPTFTYFQRLTFWEGAREFQFISMTGDATETTVLYLPKEKILLTGDLFAYPEPYFTPPLGQHAASLRSLLQMDADVIIPAHGPATRDKAYLKKELALLEEIVAQTRKAVRDGLVTVEEVQKAVKVDELLARFVGGDKGLEEFEDFLRLDISLMVENAYREARDGEKFTY